eukprot:UN07326
MTRKTLINALTVLKNKDCVHAAHTVIIASPSQNGDPENTDSSVGTTISFPPNVPLKSDDTPSLQADAGDNMSAVHEPHDVLHRIHKFSVLSKSQPYAGHELTKSSQLP